MKIGILGGSFDPPHRGHVAIANRLLRLGLFDEIWLMPCYQHPFNKNLSAPDKRWIMTKLLEKNAVKVSDLEIKNKTTSYAINTLRYLADKFPDDNFSWIIGTDQIAGFAKWKNWKEIINNFKLIVVPRAGYKRAKEELKKISKQVANSKNIVLIDKKTFPPIYISSTLIRQKIKANKSISNLVPKGIEKYIIKNKLYS
jgi:nicotinate-nucleotide adenylyltransferase